MKIKKILLRKSKVWHLPYNLVVLILIILTIKYLPSMHEFDDPELQYVEAHLRKYLGPIDNSTFTNTTDEDIIFLNRKVKKLNEDVEVWNTELYGAVKSDTAVLIVQVHRDVERLQLLVVSLAQIRDIETVLLIFSHSYYDNSINELIKSISFCKVAQIFYPFSVQLFPMNFPGNDPIECKQNLSSYYCSNRDARVTEHKHHWWWMAHMVFSKMIWSHAHKGTVMFLQEDDYVLPDILHILKYVERATATIPDLEVMAFGRPYAKYLDYDLLTIDSWRPPFTRGLAFKKTVWKKITALSEAYCMYDDASWSSSLLNLFGKFPLGHVDMVACLAPRVMSTGMFQKRIIAMEKIRQRLKIAKLYPEKVKAVAVYEQLGRVTSKYKPPRGNGGWSDARDHLLCFNPFLSTTTEEFDKYDETSTPLGTFVSAMI